MVDGEPTMSVDELAQLDRISAAFELDRLVKLDVLEELSWLWLMPTSLCLRRYLQWFIMGIGYSSSCVTCQDSALALVIGLRRFKTIL